MDFSIIERSGLTQGEVADLVGISRVTMNHYINKPKYRGTRGTKARIEGVFSILERLVELEKLPKAIPTRDKARRAILMAKLHTVVQERLDPVPANE